MTDHPPSPIVCVTPAPVIIGFDTEYVPQGLGAKKHRPLSYQTWGLAGDREWSWIDARLDFGRRPTLVQVLSATILEGQARGALPAWPEDIILVSHFTPADLSMLGDFRTLKRQLKAVRRCLVNFRPLVLTLYDRSRNAHVVRVTIRDTLLLAPTGHGKLEAIGDLIGIDKVDVEARGFEKDRMDLLLDRDRGLFDSYALRDAEIAAKYLRTIFDLCGQDLGIDTIPITLGGIAVAALLRHFDRQGIDQGQVLGILPRTARRRFFERTGRSGLVWGSERRSERRLRVDPLAEVCYHGARNESFWFGPTRETEGPWFYFDLASAYPTAMSAIRTPDWERAYYTSDAAEFRYDVLGFARVRFSFPAGAMFPCLPWWDERDDGGLIYLRRGETHVPSPLISAARELGAQVEILDGVIVPWRDAVYPFGQVIRDFAERRAQHPEDTLYNLLFKEAINALYGKTAQGISGKRTYDPASGSTTAVGPSAITCPAIAAYTTGLIQAVMGLVIHKTTEVGQVLSVTTDGFLSSVPLDEISRRLEDSELCRWFAGLRQDLSGSPSILRSKGTARQLFLWRTRGVATLNLRDGDKPILARGGIQTPWGSDPNAYVLERVINRHLYPKLPQTRGSTLREIVEDEGDFVANIREEKGVNREFDFKRRPVDPEMIDTSLGPHLAYRTEPWDTEDAYLSERRSFRDWRKARGRYLRTLDDLRDFSEYKATVAARALGMRGTARDIANRLILRAYLSGAWGFAGEDLRLSAAARLMRLMGQEISLDDLRNAKRAAGGVPDGLFLPPTPEVWGLIDMLRRMYPGFEPYGRVVERGFDLVPDLDTVPRAPRIGLLAVLAERDPEGHLVLPANDHEVYVLFRARPSVPRRAFLVRREASDRTDAE